MVVVNGAQSLLNGNLEPIVRRKSIDQKVIKRSRHLLGLIVLDIVTGFGNGDDHAVFEASRAPLQFFKIVGKALMNEPLIGHEHQDRGSDAQPPFAGNVPSTAMIPTPGSSRPKTKFARRRSPD